MAKQEPIDWPLVDPRADAKATELDVAEAYSRLLQLREVSVAAAWQRLMISLTANPPSSEQCTVQV